MLIDQLFITGNGKNRFISCNFNKGRLDLKSAKIVKADNYFRKLTVEYLKNNYRYVENSIFTDIERNSIRGGIIF